MPVAAGKSVIVASLNAGDEKVARKRLRREFARPDAEFEKKASPLQPKRGPRLRFRRQP
jgi:hypothetical protein